MQLLTPHKRGSRAWKDWLACALALQRRCLWQGGLLGAGVITIAWLAVKSSTPVLALLLALTGAPVILALFTVLAAVADGRHIFYPATAGWATFGRLLVLGVLSWLVLLVIFSIGAAVVKTVALLGAFEETRIGVQPVLASTRDFSWHLTVAASLLVVVPLVVYLLRGLCFALAGWFLIPLLLDARLPLLDSYALARRGEDANRPAIIRARALAVVLAVGIAISGGFLALIVLPLLGALQYVSYRDVFLGRPANSEQPAGLSLLDAGPAAAGSGPGGLS